MTKIDQDFKDQIIKTLTEEITVQATCKKLGIARQTFYRHIEEDEQFAKDVKNAIKEAVIEMNDECENRVIQKIRNDDAGMIKFWLRYRHPDYKQSYIVTK